MKTITPPSTPLLIEDLGMQYATEKSKYKIRFGNFECQCGKIFKTRICDVNNGTTKSCGCHKIKTLLSITTKHGMSKTKLFCVWQNIKNRCLNEKTDNYKYYGGRGIAVCDEWSNDFKAFYDWAISNGYKEGLTIDRRDNDLGYHPSNCRFVNRTIQARNRRVLNTKNTSGYKGVSWHQLTQKWRAKIKVKYVQISLGLYATKEEAAKAYDNYVILNDIQTTINFPHQTK